MYFVNYYRATFSNHAILKETIYTFKISHIRIQNQCSNRASCFHYFPLHFKNCFIFQNNIRSCSFICISINVRNKFHHFYTVIFSFHRFLFVHWKIVALFPLFCCLFLCTFCFLRGRYLFCFFLKSFACNTIFLPTGTHATPNQKYHNQ